jgi:hypothetical protein
MDQSLIVKKDILLLPQITSEDVRRKFLEKSKFMFIFHGAKVQWY